MELKLLNAQTAQELNIPRVLILDDNVFDRARVRRVIQVARIRCFIREVECLFAAETAVHGEEYDIVVLDYDLPDGTGHDAIRMIRQSRLNSQVPLVMITGNQSAKVFETAWEIGCMACISKDCLSPDILNDVFAKALGRIRDRAPAPLQFLAPKPRPNLYVVD